MADNRPAFWSLSLNPPINNYGTYVDKRLTTITTNNPKGYIPLEVNSTIEQISNLHYAIDRNGKVTYARVNTNLNPTNPDYIIKQFNSIQEIANSGYPGYTGQTTELIKNNVSRKLTTSTQEIIVNKTTEQSPYAPPSGGTNPPSSGQTPGGTQEQGSTPSITPDDSKRIYNIISNGQKARTKYDGELKYPEKYDGNDYLTIEMIRYVPNKNLSLGRVGSDQDSGELFDTNLGLPGISERSSSEKTIARFTLPIPANLIDANPVNWSQDELNPLQAYGAGAIGRILGSNNFASGIGNELKRGSETLRANSDAAKTVLNNELIRQILGVNTLTRSTGAIVNPNVELLFKGPSLRTFTFSFKMTPRSQKESEIIKKIIRRLKQGMSIKRASNGIFLASPNVFKLKFWYVPPVSENDSVTGGTPREHPYLPKFKVCALQNMSVNYMPDGSYMTYGDGSMIGYDMTLTFSEIDPIFDEDYTKLDGDKDESIGY